MTEIIYNGKVITDIVNIKTCKLHDYAGNSADDATIIFPDGDRLWRKWWPEKGDKITVKADDYTSGLLYIDNITQAAGLFTIQGISTPLSAKKIKSRIWRNVTLLQIISDIAKNSELKAETYGITDYSYRFMSQMEQSDIGFLNDICIREGYCCKVTNEKLIIFSERYMEKNNSKITIKPEDVKPEYNFSVNSDVLQSFNVRFYDYDKGLMSYTASDNTIKGGIDRRIIPLSSIAEAQRWSKGYLRYRNKYKIIGWLPMKYISNVAAASVITASGFGKLDGKYYVDKITHDTVNNNSYLSIRQTIENY